MKVGKISYETCKKLHPSTFPRVSGVSLCRIYLVAQYVDCVGTYLISRIEFYDNGLTISCFFCC